MCCAGQLAESLPLLDFVIEHMAGAGEGTIFPRSNPTPQPPYDAFKQVLTLAELPNVYLKMTGLNELARRPDALPPTFSHSFFDESGGVPPFLRMAIDAFGAQVTSHHMPSATGPAALSDAGFAQRIMWGSDFPPVAGREGYRNSLRAVVEDPELSAEEIEWIAGRTALTVFKL